MISIIVPIYNVEKYIDECIKSIVNQTYQELEIIIVNDGSTDNSGKICDEWAKKDSRIHVFHKNNGGLMSAWKYGVNKSSGEYIGFVDSDDWIDANMYEVLLNEITATHSELALCAFIKNFESEDKPDEKERILLSEGIYDRADIIEKIYPIAICSTDSMVRGISPNRVTKLYKKELIMKVIPECPDNVSIGEDLVSTLSAITKCNRLCVIRDFYPYHYRINNASMIQSYSDTKYQKIKNLNKALIAINEKNDSVFSTQIANDYIRLILDTIEQEILLSGYDYKRLKSDIKDEAKSDSFIHSLKIADKKRINRKVKLYTFLIKLRLWSAIIFIRKIYSKIR